MKSSRRGFLKFAGLSAVGVAGSTAVATRTRASEEHEPPVTEGKRLALVIDLRKFSKDDALLAKITAACHDAHNVPDFADDPKNLKGKPTLLLCNHCDNPPCTRVCPTQATWKRAADGVVMMDWHRCIGCRYCVVACPYGSRSFNWKDPRKAPNLAKLENTYPTRMRGVVEKCTFCDERLARGQQPACVEACDNGEMVFGDLNDPESEVRQLLAEHLTIRRKPGLGTQPEVYYIVEDPRTLQEVAPAAEVYEEEGGHA
jgi:molybdopterin-containing oxidoreductase family iron-sulfur binding subunit